ncbi:MAG: ABC transporter permease [Actinomycetota bacterium]
MITLVTRSVRAHRGRLTLTFLAVALSVSFVTASFVLADSLRAVFGEISAEIYGGVDAEIRAGVGEFDRAESGERFDAAILDAARAVDGIAEIVPVVEARDAIFAVGPDGEVLRPQGPPVLAFSTFGDSTASPFTTVAGRPPGPGEIALDRAQAAVLGAELGDPIEVATPAGTRTFTLVGTITFGDMDAGVTPYFLHLDLATIQDLLDADGTVDTASVVFEPGADAATVFADLEAAVPTLLVADRATLVGEQEDEFGQVIDLVQLALLVFAGITLFVSTFVIANTFAVLVGQQQRELGLLRAVGATTRQATALVVGEAALVGAAATLLGVGGGLLVAEGITALFAAVTDGGFPAADRAILPRTVVLAAVVGVGVTVVSAVVPARRAGRVSPLEAMGCGGDAATAPSGVGRIVAWFASLVAGRLGAPGRLAATSIARNPRRVLTTAMSMIVGVGLISAMAVFAASYRATIAERVESGFDADLIVTGADGVTVPLAAVEALADVEGLAAFSGYGSSEVRSGGDVLPVVGLRSETADGTVLLDVLAGDPTDLGTDRTAVSADLARRRALSVGDQLPVEFSDGAAMEVEVAAIVDPGDLLDGEVLLDSSLVARHARNVEADFAALRFADGVDVDVAAAAVDEALAGHPQLTIESMDEHLAGREAQAQQLLLLANGLLALTVVVALTGIANTVALSLLERRRELGLLRAVGMTPRQVRAMVRREALVLSTFGATIGLAAGTGIAVLLAPLAPDALISIVRIPVGSLATYLVVAVAFGVLAAVGPARRAGRLDVLGALRVGD